MGRRSTTRLECLRLEDRIVLDNYSGDYYGIQAFHLDPFEQGSGFELTGSGVVIGQVEQGRPGWAERDLPRLVPNQVSFLAFAARQV